MSLQGKTVLISGGVKNLGALVAKEFASLGASNFVLHYHSPADKANGEALVAELEKKGAKAVLFQGALEKVAVNKELFETAIREFGGLDIAVNTVGRVLKKPITEISEVEYDGMMNTNAKAAFFFIQEAGLKLNKGGKIILLVTSLLAAYTPFYAMYAGSKAPVEHFVRAASKEFTDKQISINSIAPGPMDTPFFYGQESKESVEYLKTQSLNGKLTDIKDIAPIIRFLATEGWWFNGQCLFPNGGFTTR